MRPLLAALLLVSFALPAGAAPVRDKTFPWREWAPAVFEQAKAQGKFVLLSLQSWWCPWCDAMNEQTYGDEQVRAYLGEHYLTVRVDQDSRPDISQRYERWGWPATVVFGPDGTEIVKLRGFYSPQFFMPILQEIVKDPSPIDYGTRGGPERPARAVRALSDEDRARILKFMDEVRDDAHGGWGERKFTDAPTFLFALERAKTSGDPALDAHARRTVDAFAGLIDDETGAVSQISLNKDWSNGLREFPMFAQEAGLTVFSQAYALWGEPAHREAADKVYRYLTGMMQDPSGAFYASMGLEKHAPGIDKRLYARETAMAATAVLAYYDATGEPAALASARRAIGWGLVQRRRPDGGFDHGPADRGGPFLVDSLAMGRALLALYRSTGERVWLTRATTTADFIADHFVDADTGGFMTTARKAASHLSKPPKQKDDNVAAVRFFNLLHYYTGRKAHAETAERGMGYLASPPVTEAYHFLPGVLLAESELNQEPVKLTVVGARDDPNAAALLRAALAYPTRYKRVQWWDKSEGRLAYHDVDYPDYPQAAAFACTSRFCSLPVTEPAAVAQALDRLERALP